jgi:hypothetical protein
MHCKQCFFARRYGKGNCPALNIGNKNRQNICEKTQQGDRNIRKKLTIQEQKDFYNISYNE